MAQHFSLLFGPQAKGSIGQTYTFANVKGRGIAKAKPTPSNPKTTGQTTQRTNFASIVTQWHDATMLAPDKIAWNTRATKTLRGMSGWNAFMGFYRKVFAAGDSMVYITSVTTSVVAPNLTVAGSISADKNLTITIYTETGVFSYQTTALAAAGSFTKDIALALIPAQGWAKVEVSDAGFGGACGYYHYVAP